MTSSAFSVVWNPAPLTGRLLGALGASAVVAKADAASGSPTPKAGVTGPVLVSSHEALLVGTGLTPVFERGRRGGYPIVPHGESPLIIPGVGFRQSAVGGAMRAQPFMRPAAFRWASGYYQDAARGSLALGGGLSRIGLP